MSILHIVASVDPCGGGPIEGILQQARHRPPDRFEVNIATFDDPSAPYVQLCPVKVFALGERKNEVTKSFRQRLPWKHYGYTPKLIPWLRENVHRYDVVIVNGLWNFATFSASRALAKSNRPYVVFTHGMLDPWFRKTYQLKTMLKQVFWWFCEGPLLNNARAVLFTSEEEKVLAHDAFWPYRLKERVIGYGTSDVEGDIEVQDAAFRARVPALARRKYLLFLSRIHPKKGCDLLIDAFARVASENPDLDLVIAGPDQTGWRNELESQASALGIASRIHWPGMLSGDVKWGAFRGAEAFVLPSHQENFGIVVAEAMACGRPVLLTDKVNIWREVQATGSGLVEPDTAEGVERLLERFIALPEAEKVQMGEAARATFLDRFEVSKTVETINQALRDAIG